MKLSTTPPTCFISYSWDSEAHKEWVYGLAEDLRENEIDVILDQYAVAPGNDFIAFMERSIRRSKFVLLICTPKFVAKSKNRRNGVGYEGAIVASELLYSKSPATQRKFVPIVREGAPSRVVPAYLTHRAHLDFRDDRAYADELAKLVLHLHGKPQRPIPPLGRNKDSVKAPSPTSLLRAEDRHLEELKPRVRRPQRNVFVSVSSVPDSISFLHAVVFALLALGFVPQTALENSSSQFTVNRILRAIRESEWTVHNLQTSTGGPEGGFIAAFELGVAVAYASEAQTLSQSLLLMSASPKHYKTIRSVLSRFDVVFHYDDPGVIISKLCAFATLLHGISGTLPASVVQMYKIFVGEHLDIATSLGLSVAELRSPEYLLDYINVANAWLLHSHPPRHDT